VEWITRMVEYWNGGMEIFKSSFKNFASKYSTTSLFTHSYHFNLIIDHIYAFQETLKMESTISSVG